MGVLTGQCAEWKKELQQYCSQSGLDEKWWADSEECYCYLRNVQDFLAYGKTPYERRFGEPFRGPRIPLVDWLNTIPFQCETNQDFTNLARTFYQESFLGMHWSRREFERRHFDCGFGRVGKDARIGDPSSKNQCKGSVDATKGRTFHFPSCRWYIKTVRKRPRSARTHSKAGPQNQKMTLKLGETSGRFTVTSSVVIIWNLEFNSVRHKKKHSLFHWSTLT